MYPTKYYIHVYLFAALVFVKIPTGYAATVNTGNYAGTNSSAVPLNANQAATPRSIIRFELGGAKYPTSGGQLTIAITVDSTTPVVTSGTAADQAFRDDTVSAAFFGYYLTTGTRSSGQTAANLNVKVRRGAGETSGRSYYLLGNGTTSPTAQSSLTQAPVGYTTFATTTPNTIRCGPSHVANGLSGTAINCSAGTNVTNMDITQFVKVAFSDPPGVAISSRLDFIAVAE